MRKPQTEERREIFSPRERSVIIREFFKDVNSKDRTGGEYRGTKLGLLYEIHFSPEGDPVILWRVCLDREMSAFEKRHRVSECTCPTAWKSGRSLDVFHALLEIASKIENKEFERRLERTLEQEVA